MAGAYIDLANPVSDHPLNTGLVECWLPLPNGQSGATLFGLLGRYPGTLQNGVGRSSGLLPEFASVTFDGGNDQIDCGIAINSQVSGTAVSFAALIRLSGAGTRIIVRNDAGSGGGGTGFAFRINSAHVQLEMYPEVDSASGATTLANDVWYHVAGTFQGGTAIRVYLDGTPDGVNTTGIQASLGVSGSSLIHGSYGGGEYFAGRMAGVWAWNRTLSASEVFAHAQQCRQGFPDILRRFSRRAYLFGSGGAAPPAGNRRRRILLGAA